MKKFIFTFAICLFTSYIFPQGTWTQKANFGGGARYDVDKAGFSIGTKGYFGLGFNGSFLNDFWEYDQISNVWTQVANFPGTPRIGAVGFSIGTKGYVGTGRTGAFVDLNDFWEYDPAINTWTQKSNVGGPGRVDGTGFSICGKGYIGIGTNNSLGNLQDFWEYDPVTNIWTQKANYAGNGQYASMGFAIGTKGYIGTGGDASSIRQNDFWEYDPGTNMWTQKANYGGAPMWAGVGFSIDCKGYIGLGQNASGTANDFWEYDPIANVWTQVANFAGTARWMVAGISIGTKGYVGTGENGGNLIDFWEFTPGSVCNNVLTVTISSQNILCNGQCTGAATAIASFGFTCASGGVYTYSWSNGDTTQTITGLCVGTYSVTVTDAVSNTATATVIITQPPLLTATTTPTNSSCIGNNGSATITANGGTPGYTYLWSPSGQTASTATGLAAGNYTVTITDANGCTQTATVTVTQTGGPTVSTSSTPQTCTQGGTATANASGGTAPYTYQWCNGATTSSATGLSAGSCTVMVTDANGCTQTATVTISQTGGPTLATSSTPQTCTQGGTATANASGGTAPYTYQWCNGATTSSATGLSAGSCTVMVTDANGCSTIDTVTIASSGNIPVVTSASTPASCGINDGTATAMASGGTSPYSYQWSNGQTTATATGLSPGTYTVTVTDAAGCTQTATVTVTQTAGPTATAASNVTITQGQNATLTAGGGGTYLWSNGSTGNPIVVSPPVTTIYCVTVTDANNCSDTACVTVTVVGEPVDCTPIQSSDAFDLPNAFSPNGDGQNDEFHLLYSPLLVDCVEEIYIAIYNRWGERVFEGTTINFSWDGTFRNKPENTAVFAYYLKAVLHDGTEIKKKGNISLIR